MEYLHPSFLFIGLLVMIFYTLNFFKVGKKGQIYLPSSYIKNRRVGLKASLFVLGIVALSLLTVSLMGPRKMIANIEDQVEVSDIFFVVDTSNSMLALDFEPNRLEVAKEKIAEFLSLDVIDRIGLVIFGEKVMTLSPLTIDLNLIRSYIKEIEAGVLGGGTNIGDAIALAVARGNLSEAKNKVIILLTDGVSNVGLTTPLESAQKARDARIKIYTIGIGTEGEVAMPDGIGGVQRIPGGSIDLKGMQEISKITDGKFYLARDSQALQEILDEIGELEKTKLKIFSQRIYEELYWPYLVYGLLLLCIVELSRRFFLREAL